MCSVHDTVHNKLLIIQETVHKLLGFRGHEVTLILTQLYDPPFPKIQSINNTK